MSISRRHFLSITFVLLAFFAWAQCASLWHEVDHTFHQHTEFCDTLLAGHAQTPQVATPLLLTLAFNNIDFWQPTTTITSLSFFTWSFFSPRAPPNHSH